MRRALALAVAMIVPASAATPAIATSSDDGYLADQTNAARANAGLPGYAVFGDLEQVAQQQADRMAASDTLYHNPNLGGQVCCWEQLGENVGSGPNAASIQQAFMNSPDHRANILSSAYTQVGIATARGSDGALYVDEVFRQPAGGSGTPTAAPVPRETPLVASRDAARSPLVQAPNRLVLIVAALRRRDHRASRDPIAGGQRFWLAMHDLAG